MRPPSAAARATPTTGNNTHHGAGVDGGRPRVSGFGVCCVHALSGKALRSPVAAAEHTYELGSIKRTRSHKTC